jgi:hypothetical protein
MTAALTATPGDVDQPITLIPAHVDGRLDAPDHARVSLGQLTEYARHWPRTAVVCPSPCAWPITSCPGHDVRSASIDTLVRIDSRPGPGQHTHPSRYGEPGALTLWRVVGTSSRVYSAAEVTIVTLRRVA